jgi:hypothetical protein
MIHEGILGAFGVKLKVGELAADFEQDYQEKVNAPSTSVEILVHGADRATMCEARDRDVQATAPAEAARKWAASNLTAELGARVELADLVVNGPPLEEFKTALIALGIRREEFNVSFFHSIPTIDVLVTLIRARDRDFGRAIDRNDAKDVTFLSVAVPYCNVVVLENFWGHIVQSTGLDRKYDTRVLTEVSDLRRHLTALGCL